MTLVQAPSPGTDPGAGTMPGTDPNAGGALPVTPLCLAMVLVQLKINWA